MRIKEIKSQYRRDFTATYECEHCGHEESGHGYDDACFHNSVISAMACKRCGKKAGDDYTPRDTEYPEGMQV